MPGRTIIGALASLLVLGAVLAPGASARADWQTPIAGAHPILPARFVPMGFRVLPGHPTLRETLNAPDDGDPDAPALNVRLRWSLPLVDRTLNPGQKAADLTPELQNAILRIEPMYDPTRLDGPDTTVTMSISPGTAAMNNVFADRWRIDSTDANVNANVAYVAMAWHRDGPIVCDAFYKNRHHGFAAPALTALAPADCRKLQRRAAYGFRDAPPIPILTVGLSLPVFAAPEPGSRMSSRDFWAAQRTRIAEIEAHLHEKWDAERRVASTMKPRW